MYFKFTISINLSFSAKSIFQIVTDSVLTWKEVSEQSYFYPSVI